jgi:hypothetical protein
VNPTLSKAFGRIRTPGSLADFQQPLTGGGESLITFREVQADEMVYRFMKEA